MGVAPGESADGGAAAPGAPADHATDVSLVLERLHSWLRRATPPVEWNTVALSTLAEVSRRGPQRVTDLVAAARITQPGMTSLVSRMAAAGLVVKEADPADGRVTLVSATPAGLAYLEQIHERRAQVIAAHVRGLSQPHLHSLVAALDALETLAAQPISPGAEST
jgi:DNA-binding MarR family transcriptional regulator